jgi:hypothetical protein
MRALILIGLLIAAGGCRSRSPAPQAQANPEAITLLKTPENPYRIIYSPPVDLAKKPGP